MCHTASCNARRASTAVRPWLYLTLPPIVDFTRGDSAVLFNLYPRNKMLSAPKEVVTSKSRATMIVQNNFDKRLTDEISMKCCKWFYKSCNSWFSLRSRIVFILNIWSYLRTRYLMPWSRYWLLEGLNKFSQDINYVYMLVSSDG